MAARTLQANTAIAYIILLLSISRAHNTAKKSKDGEPLLRKQAVKRGQGMFAHISVLYPQ